eukprot:SAG31_NODE_2355_length_5879_cov_6.732526_1_plen_383_part_00
MCDAGGQQTLPLQLLPEEQREGASGAAKSQPITPVLEAPMIDVQKLDRLQQLLATSRALVNGDLTLEQAKQLHAHETRVVTRPDGTNLALAPALLVPASAPPLLLLLLLFLLPLLPLLLPLLLLRPTPSTRAPRGLLLSWRPSFFIRGAQCVFFWWAWVGTEEWLNIICPADATPGMQLEVKKGNKSAIVLVPDGVHPGDKFNAVASHVPVAWGNDDLERKISNTVYSDHELVVLPDGSEEWRNITCPPGGHPGKTLELKMGGKRAVVLVPYGVKTGDRFNAKPVHFTTKRKQKADSSGSDHQLCAHPDGGWVWRNVLCPPDCKPGAPLQLTSAGVNMVVMVPPGTEVGDVFDARPIDYGKGCYFLVFVPTIREMRDFYRDM